jgi:hypothetical protein
MFAQKLFECGHGRLVGSDSEETRKQRADVPPWTKREIK